MTHVSRSSASTREPELPGQTVVVIGGSAGIGLETGRRARVEGAEVILTGRDPARLESAAAEIGAQSTATFDANDSASLERFFEALPTPIDHVMVKAGAPHYASLLEPTWRTSAGASPSISCSPWRWPGAPLDGCDQGARCCS